MRTVLVVADDGDALARHITDRLPRALRCHAPDGARFSFAIDPAGQVSDGFFEIDDLRMDWGEIGGIVFRPGPAWPSPSRARSIPRAFALHEWRAAWSALLAAFPGPVVDRLPPGWFLDRRRYNDALAGRLATCLGARLAAEPDKEEAALIVGSEVLPVDANAESARFHTWLHGRMSALQAWQQINGVRCARIEGRRERAGWAICSIDQVPSADGMSRKLLARWAQSMCALVAA